MEPEAAAAALRPAALMLAAGEVAPSCAHTPLTLAEDDGEEEDGDEEEEEECEREPLVLAFTQLSGEAALPAGVISAGSEPRSFPALCCC